MEAQAEYKSGESKSYGEGFFESSGDIAIDAVAEIFSMSKTQLAETAGMARESLYKAARAKAPKTQIRMREMLEILTRVSAWAGGGAQAMAWYRAEPIPGFGGRTAESIVKSGQAGALRDYLDHIAMGGFA
jgi:uncharacterized protein (DUF2384 family)